MSQELFEKLEQFKNTAIRDVSSASNLDGLHDLKVKFLGKKGELTEILKSLGGLSNDGRKEIGQKANEVKQLLTDSFEKSEIQLKDKVVLEKIASEKIDVTLTGLKPLRGSHHPVMQVFHDSKEIFKNLGFDCREGPEIETEYYNFEALNIPPHHPARDTQDTFYIKGPLRSASSELQRGEQAQGDKGKGKEKLLLRTHTSPVQVRAMQKYGAPLRVVVPGRVFRYEALDASHDNNFNQLEGLMVDENISIANVIAVMKTLLRGIFKKDVKVRLRPGYFPFVEPGFELDIHCLICGGKGCSVCKQSGWVELLPCGMVHPNVLRAGLPAQAGGVDPQKYSGFAFGLGLTRLVMMRYGIDDIRLLNSGDLRFLKQF